MLSYIPSQNKTCKLQTLADKSPRVPITSHKNSSSTMREHRCIGAWLSERFYQSVHRPLRSEAEHKHNNRLVVDVHFGPFIPKTKKMRALGHSSVRPQEVNGCVDGLFSVYTRRENFLTVQSEVLFSQNTFTCIYYRSAHFRTQTITIKLTLFLIWSYKIVFKLMCLNFEDFFEYCPISVMRGH